MKLKSAIGNLDDYNPVTNLVEAPSWAINEVKSDLIKGVIKVGIVMGSMGVAIGVGRKVADAVEGAIPF